MPGTYSRALRANVWALLFERDLRSTEERKYRHLLQQDKEWLERAIYADGYYDYTAPRDREQAVEGKQVLNPAFDVTPAEYITAIVTEQGVAYPPYSVSLPSMVAAAEAKRKVITSE